MGESIFIFWGVRSDLRIFISFFDEISLSKQNSPDGTPRSAASHLGLCCLPIIGPIKRSPGLYDLSKHSVRLLEHLRYSCEHVTPYGRFAFITSG